MKIILVTPTDPIEGEIEKIIHLFEEGLQTLHLRKPKSSKRSLETYIKSIPIKFHNRIIIHGHYELAAKYKLKGVNFLRDHRANTWSNRWKMFLLRLKSPDLIFTTTFKSLESLQNESLKFDYVILNPVFTAKAHYNINEQSGLNLLSNAIQASKQKVFAMGGVNPSNFDIVNKAGFAGIAMSEELLNKNNSSLKVIHSAA